MDIGKKIKELRTKRNLTQEELAQRLCITPQAVSRWECGISVPDISMIPLISRTLSVSADILLDCNTPNGIDFESCKELGCSGEILNQSQIDSIFVSNGTEILNQNQIYSMLVSSGTPKKVLIADDSDFMRMMLADILKKAGHTVVQADNGKLALKVLEKEKIDVCILDIMMPEMNGIDTLKQIIANIPDMPVIMLSALCNEHIVREALEIGANSFVAKPFQPDSILKRI